MNAPSHVDGENACCPRCGGSFHCGVAEGLQCPCGQPTLQPATLSALRHRYNQCLCLRCLGAVADGASIEPVPPLATAPARPQAGSVV